MSLKLAKPGVHTQALGGFVHTLLAHSYVSLPDTGIESLSLPRRQSVTQASMCTADVASTLWFPHIYKMWETHPEHSVP